MAWGECTAVSHTFGSLTLPAGHRLDWVDGQPKKQCDVILSTVMLIAPFHPLLRYTIGSESVPVILAAYEADSDDPALPAGLGVFRVVET